MRVDGKSTGTGSLEGHARNCPTPTKEGFEWAIRRQLMASSSWRSVIQPTGLDNGACKTNYYRL